MAGKSEIPSVSVKKPRKRSPSHRSKSDITRERILESAASIFSDRGYSGATMRDIAQAADMKAGSLYYYYPSKELLIEAVIDQGIHSVSTSVYRAIAGLPPSSNYCDRIRAAISAHFESILKYDTFASLSRHLLAQVPEDIRRKHVERRDAYSDFWLNLLVSAAAAGELRQDLDLRLARTFLLGGMNSALDWYRPNGKSIDELAEHFAAITESGLFLQAPPECDD